MSDSTKQSIIKSASKLFATKGYEGTSIRELAEASGVNVASINYYFGSKQGLFEEMVKDFADNKVSSITPLLEGPKSQEEFRIRLSMFMKQFIHLATSDREHFRMINKNLDTFFQLSPEGFEKTFFKIHEKFHEFVAFAQKHGVLRDDLDSEMITQILFGNLIEFVRAGDIRTCFAKGNIDDPEYCELYIQTLIDSYLNGVGKHA